MDSFYLNLTLGAEGTALGKGNIPGYPVNNYIEKTANHAADDKDISAETDINQYDH